MESQSSSITTKVSNARKKIAILGVGPSGLFVFKRLIESGNNDLEITLFERKDQLGAGMPYSKEGANGEHVTNVSDNEIPHVATTIEEWMKTVPEYVLESFHTDASSFNEYKVLPRLLFGQYLVAQFNLMRQKAVELGIPTQIFHQAVVDILDLPETEQVEVTTVSDTFQFDHVVICTGHNWPKKEEESVQNYFNSPYPPSKLAYVFNHPVAIRGSSLTAIDAIRTLSRNNGKFTEDEGRLVFLPSDNSPNFKLILHSKNGLLPAIRFHLEEAHISTDSTLSEEEVNCQKLENEGFLPLDFVFEKAFKEKFIERDPSFYHRIKDMKMEHFVDSMMSLRERMEPFQLFRAEYQEAEKSIKRKESIHWKEMLAVLSFAMNQPAKYFSAEDTVRLQQVLMPLISVVIAFVPQSSCKELFALHDAGRLEIISVGEDSKVVPEINGGATYHYTDEANKRQAHHYQTFVDCIGQPHLPFDGFPFKSLLDHKTISPARLMFRSQSEGRKAISDKDLKVEQDAKGDYYLKVSGLAINDQYQVVNGDGVPNKRIFIMAVPYIGGFNPDYSGLDFCEVASERIVNTLLGQ